MKFVEFMKRHRNFILRLIDILAIIIAYIFVELFKSETLSIFTSTNTNILVNTIIVSILVYQTFLSLFDSYKNIIRYENGKDYLIYGFGCMVSCVITSMIGSIFKIDMMGPRSNLLAGVLVSVIMITYRLIIRLFLTDSIVHKSEIISAKTQKFINYRSWKSNKRCN